MSQEMIETTIRSFAEALVKRDVEKTLSFLSEDAAWVAPEGRFVGKDEIRRFLTWNSTRVQELSFTDAGFGIMVQGNKAVREYMLRGMTGGLRWEAPAVCVYEFSGDKMKYHRVYYDRLVVAKQAAKGWIPKRVMNAVVKAWEKGLR